VRRTDPWTGVAFVIFAFLFRLMSAWITVSVLPAFERDFGVAAPSAELTLTLFLGLAGALIAPSGILADKYGRVRLFTYGTIGMIVGNLMSALAPNFGVLLVSRIIEAVSFPAMGAASLALVAKAFTDPKPRSRAFGLYGATYGAALALASAVGGFFAADLSWRWSFAMMIPVLLIALFGVRWTLRGSDDPHPTRRFDWFGTTLLALFVLTLFIGMEQVPVLGFEGWPAGLVLLSGVSLLLLIGWEYYLSRNDKQPIFDRLLLASPGFLVACIVSFLMMFGAFATFTVLPVYWSLVGQGSVVVVGVALVPMGVGWMIGSPLAVPVGARIGARRTVVLGLIIGAIGMAGLGVVVSQSGSAIPTIGPLALLGFGIGLAYTRVNEAGLREVADRFTGLGSGMLIGFRLFAAGLGGLLLAQALTLVATHDAEDKLTQDQTLSAAERTHVEHAIEAAGRGRYTLLLDVEDAPALRSAALEVTDSYTTSVRFTMAAGCIILLAGAFVATRLPRSGGRRHRETS